MSGCPPSADIQHLLDCSVCSQELRCRWTDTHGVGACWNCGAPYRIYHYDDDNNRLDEPPKVLLKGSWLPLLQRYWRETSRNVDPGYCNFPGSSYEVATAEDERCLNGWLDAHKDEWPDG